MKERDREEAGSQLGRRNITALWSESRRVNPAVRAFLTLWQEMFEEPMNAPARG